ncbi:MAG: hypothetical protein SGILL_006007, partial [Bacillariaceae sp.]
MEFSNNHKQQHKAAFNRHRNDGDGGGHASSLPSSPNFRRFVKKVSSHFAGASSSANSPSETTTATTLVIRPRVADKSKAELCQELERTKSENTVLRRRVLDLEIQLQQVTQALENALNDDKDKGEQKRDTTKQHNNNNEFAGLPLLRAGTVTVGKKLGEGSFGAVFRATWRGVRCALKFVSQETVDELRKEVSIMERIDHPNIVRLYGVVVEKQGEQLPES